MLPELEGSLHPTYRYNREDRRPQTALITSTKHPSPSPAFYPANTLSSMSTTSSISEEPKGAQLAAPQPAHQSTETVVDYSKSMVKVSATSAEVSQSEFSTEKGEVWQGFEEDVLPEKVHGRFLRNLRWQLMSLYRRLFGIVFCVNLGVFIWYAVKGANAEQLGRVVLGNLFAAVLMRQEYVINSFFFVACLAPRS